MSGTTPELDFSSFFQAEYDGLLMAMSVHCRSLAEAQDIAQEAMARAYERWDTLRLADSPSAYVYRVAFNLRRSLARRMAVALRHAVADPVVHESADVVAERRLEILSALRSLPIKQREAVLLVEWVGLTSEEAGKALCIAPDSVRGRVHRARAALRERLKVTEE